MSAQPAFELDPHQGPEDSPAHVRPLRAVRLLDMNRIQINHYANWLAGAGVSDRTITERVMFARRLVREWTTFDVPPQFVSSWLSHYRGWTKRTYYAHITSIYSWLMEEGHLEVSPLARYKSPPQPGPRPNPLSTAQVNLIIDTATGDLYAWISLGLYAGLRCHEIAKFRGEHIDQNTLIVTGKAGREHVLPTHPALWELAQLYPRRGYWFPSRVEGREHLSHQQVGNLMRDHFRASGIESGSIHRLRHTFITGLSREGVRPRALQHLARHASLATTMRYDQVEADEIQESIRRINFGTATEDAS